MDRGLRGGVRVWGLTANELQGWMAEGGVAMPSEHVSSAVAAALGV